MKKDLNKLSFAELSKAVKELETKKEAAITKKSGVWLVGKNYVIRTVTMIDVGKLVAVTDQELVLESASWIADTGRWHKFLEQGSYVECEPFPDGQVIVGRGGIVDATLWTHDLPRRVK